MASGISCNTSDSCLCPIWQGLSVSSRVPPGYTVSDAGNSLGFQETGRCVNPARTLSECQERASALGMTPPDWH
eukprot:g58015.t1